MIFVVLIMFVFYLQLFHAQQLITVLNIMWRLDILPFPTEELIAWEEAMAKCKGEIYFSDCQL